MVSDLESGRKVVGVRQLRKAVQSGLVQKVFLATDADPFLIDPLLVLCREAGVPVERECTMEALGKACRISVSAAAAGLLKDPA